MADTDYESKDPRKVSDDQEMWAKEVASSEERLKGYYKEGDEIVGRFLDQDSDGGKGSRRSQFRLNLFHTHVSTMSAMLYGRTPNISVGRRFFDANDDVSRVAALILERLLNTSVEEPGSEVPDVLRQCLQDRLLPGMGVARVRYEFDAHTEEMKSDPRNPESAPLMGDDGEPIQNEVIDDERAPIDYVHWRDFLWGYGRTWKDVPWIGFRLYFTRKDFTERFGKDKLRGVEFKKRTLNHKESEQTEAEGAKEPKSMAEVIEIWDKVNKRVVWYHHGAMDLLDNREDPLGLRGFYPCPDPMIANPTTTLFIPTADYHIAQDLYNEIDVLQTRISIITKAVKVVGVYDAKQEGVRRMLTEGKENDLIPVDNWAMMAEKGGVRGVVDWLPLEDIVNALTQLTSIREQTIDLLYQVTGLSDILRGAAPAPRESAASAQQRANFASIRVQALQDEFAGFASDLMRLRAEIVGRLWEPEQIVEKSNLNFLPESDDVKEAAMKLIQGHNRIWPWRVTIKPESMAMVDQQVIKAERMEFAQMLGVFAQHTGAMVESTPEAVPYLFEMLKWTLAGFKGAQEMEGVVDQAIEAMKRGIEARMKAAAQQGNEKAMEQAGKNQEIMLKAQAEQQQELLEHHNEMQTMMLEFRMALEEIDKETDAVARREKVQAHYNIMEKRAAEAIAARQRAARKSAE